MLLCQRQEDNFLKLIAVFLDFDIAVGILEESLVKEPFSTPIGVVNEFGTRDPAALKANLQKKKLYIAGMGRFKENYGGYNF